VVDVILISIAHAPNMLHHNDVEVTYARISNFSMELIRFVSLYFMAIPHFMVTITEVPFTTTPTHTITSMRFRPQTLRGTYLVSMQIKMPRKVDMIFAG
jgi:hypothetical protein